MQLHFKYQILCLLERGKTLRQIIDEANHDDQAYYFMNKDKCDKFIESWRNWVNRMEIDREKANNV